MLRIILEFDDVVSAVVAAHQVRTARRLASGVCARRQAPWRCMLSSATLHAASEMIPGMGNASPDLGSNLVGQFGAGERAAMGMQHEPLPGTGPPSRHRRRPSREGASGQDAARKIKRQGDAAPLALLAALGRLLLRGRLLLWLGLRLLRGLAFALAFGLAFGLALLFGLGFDFREAGNGGAARARRHARLQSLPRFLLPQPFFLAVFFVVEAPILLRPRYRVATPSVPPSGEPRSESAASPLRHRRVIDGVSAACQDLDAICASEMNLRERRSGEHTSERSCSELIRLEGGHARFSRERG